MEESNLTLNSYSSENNKENKNNNINNKSLIRTIFYYLLIIIGLFILYFIEKLIFLINLRLITIKMLLHQIYIILKEQFQYNKDLKNLLR